MLPDNTSPEVVKEAIRSAEKFLDAQLAIISALAQRSGALAAMMGAGATAMLGAELLVLNALAVKLTLGAYVVTLIAPMIMFGGCCFCGLAAGTSTFQTAGTLPHLWAGNLTAQELNVAQIGELDNYQKYLVDNDVIISRHAKYLRIGLVLGFMSPIALVLVGGAFFAIRQYCPGT